jgi:dipeptidase D
MTRSADKQKLEKVRDDIVYAAQNHGAHYDRAKAYDPWLPNFDNPINQITKDVWNEFTGSEIKITATHGGLECKKIMDKYPDLQVISVGPQIDGAHSINERVDVDSVKRSYRFLRHLLENTTRGFELAG